MRPFRRALLSCALLLLVTPAVVAAQTCLGNPSFANGHLQLDADVQTNDDATAFGVGFGGGSESVFGTLRLGGTTYEALEGTTVLVGGRLGYQVAAVSSGNVQICPTLAASFGFGPNDFDGAGTDLTTRGASFGLSLGFGLMQADRIRLIPALSAGFVYAENILENSFGSTSETDAYGVAGAALGIVLNDALSIRPSVMVPFGLDGAEPTYGIGFTLNYGGRR